VPSTSADIRNAALLSVATVAAGFLVPVLPYAGLPLAAFALGWLSFRFGHAPAMLLAVSTAGIVAIFGPSLIGTSVFDGVFVAVTLLAIGPAAAIALRTYPALNVAAVAAVAITAAFLVAPIGAVTLRESVGAWGQILDALAASGKVSDPVALKATTTAMLAQMSLTWPATSFYTMGIGTVAGVALVSRAGRSLGQDVHRYGPLADTDVSFHVVWPTIIGLGCAAAGSLWSQAPEVVGAVGTNLLMFVRPFLFLQGAAVFAALYQKMGAGRFMKIMGFVLLALMDTFVPSVSVLGIADVFANLRKLPRAGGGVPQATV
jgi:hypothetical protein